MVVTGGYKGLYIHVVVGKRSSIDHISLINAVLVGGLTFSRFASTLGGLSY